MISIIMIVVGVWWYLDQDKKNDDLELDISNLCYRINHLEDLTADLTEEMHGKENS